jgi:hypothetical protein
MGVPRIPPHSPINCGVGLSTHTAQGHYPQAGIVSIPNAKGCHPEIAEGRATGLSVLS